MNSHEAVARQFMELTRRFRENLPGRLEKIEEGLFLFFADPAEYREELHSVYFDIHKLKGTGETFGMEKLTAYAMKVEELIKEVLERGSQPEEEMKEEIWNFLALIRQEYRIN